MFALNIIVIEPPNVLDQRRADMKDKCTEYFNADGMWEQIKAASGSDSTGLAGYVLIGR